MVQSVRGRAAVETVVGSLESLLQGAARSSVTLLSASQRAAPCPLVECGPALGTCAPTSLLLPKWFYRVFLPNTYDACFELYM